MLILSIIIEDFYNQSVFAPATKLFPALVLISKVVEMVLLLILYLTQLIISEITNLTCLPRKVTSSSKTWTTQLFLIPPSALIYNSK